MNEIEKTRILRALYKLRRKYYNKEKERGAEMDSKRLHFQKADILAIIAVVLLAVIVFALFLPQEDSSAGVAEIYQNGERIKKVSLEEDQTFTVAGKYNNTVTVRDGKIAVTESDCPGEDCVHCGWMDTVGTSVVCLPNGLEIRIVAGNSDVDFVVG